MLRNPRPVASPRGEANRRADWPNSEVSAPGANSLRSRVGGFAKGPAGSVLPRAFLSNFDLYPAL